MKTKSTTIDLDGKKIIIETGLFGAQAAGAVTVRCGDTMVLAAVVCGGLKEGLDYFPLQVEYREKYYAGGVISGSRYVKREGRPSDNEILTSRLIDRSIRPLFPANFYEEVQLVISPLSIDGVNEPEILGIIGASAALSISDIPWAGPIGAVRVGFTTDGKYLVNPTNEQKAVSRLDLVVSGGTGSIAMVEAGANEVSEDEVLEGLKFGQKNIEIVITAIKELAANGKTKKVVAPEVFNPDWVKLVKKDVDVAALLAESKTSGGEGLRLDPIADALMADRPEINRIELIRIIDKAVKEHVRKQVLGKKERFDGRKTDEIRQITVQVGIIPRTHGTGYFQRGLTHALSIVTLGSPASEQLIEGMKGEERKRYMHHYNMPGFATGEPGRVGAPNRRETGHGALAERALLPMIPSQEEFPYTIRVVTEIMSGNGSTSQASVCGSTLALMDAGVPLKKPVAGIAMGLITDEKMNYVTLSDIAGIEDHLGDMDFKVAGTRDGVTAIQMDVKVPGVTAEILKDALAQAKVGRLFILDKMTAVIDKPRESVSQYAPKVASVKIPPDKIGELIGPGGKMIRQIQSDHDVEINVEEDGQVTITGIDEAKVKQARAYIDGMMATAEIGKIYTGTVTRVEPYGAFVEILPGKDGLVHVSRMSREYVADANDLVHVGDSVQVKCYEVDSQGRINLTMLLEGETPSGGRPQRESRGGYGGDRRPTGGGGRSGEGAPFKRFRDSR
ncbi:polyribonucleotide nucleotidyltransferase [Candidatus Collierbacteria bacterium RIFCSPLOWO2_01_FULL_50_23]|uniref:Polyribonucleotide nucleotidyltransferase n=2 Tax=Candidatus Collieribacteriota TaxID=1752725 RepID=A0A1F5EXB2_9BACT|nr:MAG: polyribonucleotide nucleotidyltransferase [Candidatus Collierbacteria bacterium RIFCSPHIGHO2_01_FULL_50_25]OGD72031.1 MAG: polyribonucleotide nucleotidyltransferase [Candidatus Collierbacteria bacterium RIFCSPHIGHO2_02_FULL_49_10]OGD75019.1 MAG: polyribonucleotide nucleotidyltransferase [Candidatus Collierbacteria bacterium RIFCSPLOWO2_01_FULL_50_23]